MKQNKKYFGNAVQAILDTAIEKYCVGGEENLEAIARLLNTAIDMAVMYDLKEFNSIFHTCAIINSDILEESGHCGIHRRGYRFFVQR